jgi:signal transduction histidine kinase
MRLRTARRVAWGLVGLALALLAGRLALGSYTGSLTDQGEYFENSAFIFLILADFLVGLFIVIRQPRNTIGWLLIAIPLMTEVAFLMGDYATYGLVTKPGGLPAARWAAWVDRWDEVPMFASFIPLFLLFPDGRIPSRRWRPALLFTVAAIALATISFALTPGRMTGGFSDLEKANVVNPLGLDALSGPIKDLTGIAGLATLIAAFLAGASLVVRFRSRRGDERQQVKWLAFVGLAFLSVYIVGLIVFSIIFGRANESHASQLAANIWFGILVLILVVGIPAACAIAILKYHLYDLDVVVNKTVVYALLAAFITAVYVGIVVGIGAGIGNKRNLGLSILATAVVAVAFQPVRDRVQHLANRLVYGKRATPYEVLSEFSERMSGAYATEDLLPRMARILGEGTGAATAGIWLRIGSELKPEATWPSDAVTATSSVGITDGELPAIQGVDRALPVRHHGELLGALSVTKSRGDPLRPAEEKLMEDLASGAGLVLRNVRLTEELMERLRELQASRQRIVAAQDEERRKLERNLHDGAQQQLVALQVRLSLAERVAEEGCRVKDQLASLKLEAGEALENLRDLARGIFPPLLADQGLGAALKAQARKAAIPVEVIAEGLARYPQDQEAAVYFCVLEALQNVAKYAAATHATVKLFEQNGDLGFEVTDDGAGFDTSTTSYGTGLQGMADRLAAQGGTLEVRSKPGEGTAVIGRVPVGVMAMVGA